MLVVWQFSAKLDVMVHVYKGSSNYSNALLAMGQKRNPVGGFKQVANTYFSVQCAKIVEQCGLEKRVPVFGRGVNVNLFSETPSIKQKKEQWFIAHITTYKHC